MNSTPKALTFARAKYREIKPRDFVMFKNGNETVGGSVTSIIDNHTIEVATTTIIVSTDTIVMHESHELAWSCPNCGDVTEEDTCPCGEGWTRDDARASWNRFHKRAAEHKVLR